MIETLPNLHSTIILSLIALVAEDLDEVVTPKPVSRGRGRPSNERAINS